jgi:chromosome segregation ATPase
LKRKRALHARRTVLIDKQDLLDESASVVGEIESDLEKVFKKRSEDIERELEEKVRREKEESDQKLAAISADFEKARQTLKDYRGTLTEIKTAQEALRAQMHEHLDRSVRYQAEISKLAALTLEELGKVGELAERLAEFRRTSEQRVSEIRDTLKEKYDLAAEVPEKKPEKKEENGMAADLELELTRLKKIKELLESVPKEEGESAAESAGSAPQAGSGEESGPGPTDQERKENPEGGY